MKRNYFFLAILAIALAWVATPTVMAQTTPPEPETDMTHYIANPGFEINGATTRDGWTLEATGGNITPRVSCMEVWNTTFNFYQDVTGLPEGIYRLTVQGFYRQGLGDDQSVSNHDNGTEVIGTELYCQTAIRTKTDPFNSLYSLIDAGSGAREGTVNTMETARVAFDNNFFVNVVEDIFVGTDGKLRIGARSIANTFVGGSWTIWDNFTLTYVKEPGLQGYIEVAEMTASEIANYNATYSGAQQIIYDAMDRLGAGDWGETAEEITATINELQALLDELKAGDAAIAKFDVAWASIQEWMENGTEYPGLDALMEVFGQYDGYNDPAYPEPLYSADIEAAAEAILIAIRNYRMSQEIEDPEVGLDVSFVIANHRFDDGLAGWTATGWTTFNGDNTKYNGWDTPYAEEGIAAPATNIVLDAGAQNSVAYQVFPDMPVGLYTLSAVGRGMIGPTPDMVLFIKNSTIDQVATIEQTVTFPRVGDVEGELNYGWNRLTTAKMPLYKTSDLTIGVRLGASGDAWESADDFILTYYGTGSDMYEEARTALLNIAYELENSEFLPIQKQYLRDEEAVLEDADITTDEKAQVAFEAFNLVLDSARNAIADFAAFKTTGGFNDLVAIAENMDGLYPQELQAFIGGVVIDWGETLLDELEPISIAEYEALKVSTVLYKAYADAYKAAFDYSMLTMDENANIITTIINEQTAAVEADPSRIKAATQVLIDVLAYGKAYDTYSIQLDEIEMNGEFTSDQIGALRTAFTENAATAVENQTALPKHISAMWMPLRNLQKTLIVDNDATMWIVNPSFEDDVEDPTNFAAYDRLQEPKGWTKTGDYSSEFCIRTDSAGRLTNGTGVSYFQNWRGGPIPEFKVMQTTYIPNGEYRLTAAGEGRGAGFFLVANGQEVEMGTNGEFSVQFGVINGVAHLGAHNKAGSTVDWARVDNFRLTIIRLYPDAIETIDADAKDSLVAYSQDGYIVVEGAEAYTITSIAGVQYPASAKLAAGIYIVNAGNKAAKVVVK